ncbi:MULTISPECIES: hypothetical protein [Caballeronia]|nr:MULTISPECIES: hypothetical protein [Caballeronia]EKS71922.1 hypothetical protein BURK_008806 [Burkholderia sp. SJ98]
MADFLFLLFFLAALAGCVVTRMLRERHFLARDRRRSVFMRRGLEYAYVQGVIDGQSQSVDVDAFNSRMSAWLETTTFPDKWDREAVLVTPKPVARNTLSAEAKAMYARYGHHNRHDTGPPH